MKKTKKMLKTLAVLVFIGGLDLLVFGCTMMVGQNDVEHLAPRGSYRSVDTSGQEAEGLQEMQGGGKVDSAVN